ncbi:MAG: fatty acid desaturase, partial [Prochlorotrichaceae cyanobacterium]
SGLYLGPEKLRLGTVKPLQQRKTWAGLGFSIICLAGWLGSLMLLLTSDPALTKLELIITIAVRTFLQTGLFILAHDAMHQSLWPSNARLNHTLGTIALWCYAGLDYQQCSRNHVQHHRSPGSGKDPDLQGKKKDIFRWYLNFLANYLHLKQILKILLNVSILTVLSTHFLGMWQSLFHLTLFYFLPLIFSSLQLFIFGTYLPHREICGEPPLPHHARSLDYPQWLSLLLCFHFGYHWEHHEYPQLPWYQLPEARKWKILPINSASSALMPSRELSSVL